jgi:hypothetical protein
VTRTRTDPAPEATLVANCKRLVCDFGGYLEVIGQRRAKNSGTTVGAPDAILYRRGRTHVIEFKRPDGGRLSNGQVLAMRCRQDEGVPTYVITTEQEFADLLCGRWCGAGDEA